MQHLIRVHRILEDGRIDAHVEAYPHWIEHSLDGYRLEGFEDPPVLRIPENLAWEIPEPGTIITLLVDTMWGIFGEGDHGDPEGVARLTARYLLQLLPEDQNARMEARSLASFGRVWG